MKTYTTTYDRLKATTQRTVTCPGCGNKRTIRRTFHQTVSPFNKNDDGSVRTRPEVQDSVNAQAREWEPHEVEMWHNKCAEAVSA